MQAPAEGVAQARRIEWRLPLSSVWVLVAVAIPFIGSLRTSISSIDLAYHLRAGELMLSTHHFIRTDTFSFSAAGHTWVDQQWAAQIVLALAYRAGGWSGLAVFRAALCGLIWGLVYLACRSAGAARTVSAWLAIAGFVVSLGGLVLRPQLFAMALFAASIWIVSARRAHPGRLFAIPLLVVLLANVHGSFPLAIVLLLLAWVQDVADKSPVARRTFAMAVASLAATLLNPFGLRVWTYAIGLLANPTVTRFVSEWLPPTVRDGSAAAFYLSGALVVVLFARRRKVVSFPALLFLGVFFLLGLSATRGIIWWAMAFPPVVAGLVADWQPFRSRFDRRSGAATVLAAAVMLAAFVSLPGIRLASPWDQPALADMPAGIASHLASATPDGGNVFNAQKWGSWLEFAVPKDKMFTDSRIEIYPQSVWDQYTTVSLGQEGWQSILDSRGIDVVVAADDQQAGLLSRLAADPGWRLAYLGTTGSIYVRR